MNRSCVPRAQTRALVLLGVLALVACAPRDAAPLGEPDAGVGGFDAGAPLDAGSVAVGDGGTALDGGSAADAGIGPDAGSVLPAEVVVVEVESFGPSRGPARGGTEVFLTGRGFVPGTRVTVGGAPLVDAVISGERRITGRTPAGEPGVAPVLVESAAGRAEVPGGFSYLADMALAAVTPARGPARGGTEVVLAGTGFSTETAVVFGDRLAASVRYESPERLRAVSPPGLAGSTPVSMVDRNGTATLEAGFTYVADVAVTGVDPPVGPAGGGNVVWVAGGGFGAGAQVYFGGVPAAAVTLYSPTQLEVVVPAAAQAGAVDVVVRTSGDVGSLPGGYAYFDVGGPLAIQAVVPARGPQAGGTALWIVGSGFSGGVTRVLLGGTEATAINIASDEVIQATSPAGAPGTVDVSVVGAAGGVVTLPAGFQYDSDLIVTAVEPRSGPAHGGTEVVIKGRGFDATSEVFFGPVAALSVRLIDAQTLGARTPSGPAGPVDVVVRAGERHARMPGAFTYLAEPRLFAVSPSRGAIAGGTFVTLTGAGFEPDSQVRFGGEPAIDVRRVSPVQLTARTPPGREGPVEVAVTSARSGAALPSAYEYFDPATGFGGTSGGPIRGAVNLSVYDGLSGEPLAGAFATLSIDGATRYQGITNAHGQAVFSGPDLTGRQVLTAAKEGFAAATVVRFDAENVTLYLTPVVLTGVLGPGPDLGRIGGTLVSAFKAVPPPPSGFNKVVLVTTTQADRFTPNPADPRAIHVILDDGTEDRPYEITSRPGDVAVYALAGHLSFSGTEFVPFQMGIRRFLFMPPGGRLEGVDVTMDAALVTTFEARLLGAPPLRADGPNRYRMRVFLELGAEGAVQFFQTPESSTTPVLRQVGLPRISGAIGGSTFTVVAGAYNVIDDGEFSPLSATVMEGLTDLSTPLDVGPLLDLADPVDPPDVEFLERNRFEWSLMTPPDPAYFLIYVLQPVDVGFVSIWEMIVPGHLRSTQFPDLASISGVAGLPQGEFFLWVIVPIRGPSFNIDSFDYRAFDTRKWQTWSMAPWVFLTY